jgi:hypothetical protein
MNKIILIILLLYAQLVNSQNKINGLELGVNAGTSFSSIMNAQSPFYSLHPQASMKIGFMTGLSAKYNFTQQLAIKTALSYEEKGATLESYTIFENERMRDEQIFSREINNDYLTFPLLLSWQTKSKISLYAHSGGFISLLINSRIRGIDNRKFISKDNFFPENLPAYSEENIEKFEFDTDGKSRTHKIDYGCAVGGGVYYKINDKLKFSVNSLLNISLRKLDSQYNNDLITNPGSTGIIEYKKDYFQLNSRAKNINLLVNMGLAFKMM